DRTGTVLDPFGYSWSIATVKEAMPVEEMQRRMEQMQQGQTPRTAAGYIREGFHTLTPYLIVADAPKLSEVVERVFDAKETMRAIGSAGGVHAEVRIGESMVMIGGGAPDLSWRGESRPTALHVYVEDTDATYKRALDAGAESIGAP